MTVDVVIDLETLSTRPTAPILAIGAVAFDPDVAVGAPFESTFYANVQVTGSVVVDDSTLRWWLEQLDDSRLALTTGALPIRTSLDRFAAWLRRYPDARIWANGAAFDLAILKNAYYNAYPALVNCWSYKNERDCRTLYELAGITKDDRKKCYSDYTYSPHCALDDALVDAMLIRLAFKRLKE